MNRNNIKKNRLDLLTGEIIAYKSKEQYSGSFYVNRNNLIKHFRVIDKNEVEKITKEILRNRIEYKGIKYAPSTVECRSLNIPTPSPAFIHSLGLDYNKICKECGLKTKYVYDRLSIPNNFKLTNFIFTDSREQKPLELDVKTSIIKLDFGDYALSKELNNSLSIERKSANDFISSFSKGFERFCNEILRAKEINSNILIVVDERLSTMLSFNYLPQFRWVTASPMFIFSRVRNLIQSFDNAQIVFVKNRAETAKITRFALSFGKKFFKYDVQYLYDIQKKILIP